MDIRATGTYYNPSKQQYEAWAVNQTTSEKILLGTWNTNLPDYARHRVERRIWSDFIGGDAQ